MGCASSKIDDLPAVELCRHRLGFIREALDQRYALAEAHLAYTESLKSVALSLRHFFDAAGGSSIDPSKAPPSPLLNLPTRGKGEHEPEETDRGIAAASAAAAHHLPGPTESGHHLTGGTDTGGHLSFHSESDSDFSGSDDSPLHHDDHHDTDEDDLSSSPLTRKPRHHPNSTILPGIYEDQSGYNSYGFNPNTNFNHNSSNFDPYFNGGGAGMYGASTSGMYDGGGGGPTSTMYGGGGGPISGMYGGGGPISGMYGGGSSSGRYGVSGGSTSTMHMNYMKKQPTPSVSYQHRPPGTETVQMGIDNNSYAYPYPASNPNQNSYYYNNNDPYSNNGGGGVGYMSYSNGESSGMGGFFGGGGGQSSSSTGYDSIPRQQPTSVTKPAAVAPPPPPPPTTSTWDFFNVFENIETTYPIYTPTPSRASKDSRELREEEGIPDLEDEDLLQEVVKEVHGKPKYIDPNGGGGGGASSSGSTSGEIGKNKGFTGKGVESSSSTHDEINGDGGTKTTTEVHYNARPPNGVTEPDPVQYEVHMVDKKVVGEEGRTSGGGNGGRGGSAGRIFGNVSELIAEIQVHFERASASGSDVAKILEVGKLPYHRKHSAYQVSSKMLHALAPSLPSTSRDSEAASTSAPDFDDDVRTRSKNISSTLQKLHLWEKKLLQEVKNEEKMRVVHDRKVEKLRRQDEKGAEPHKIDATRTLVTSLSTKIRISIHVVDKISVTISKVRDEELWPQLNELIQGLTSMWRSMVECHQNQCQVVQGARGLDAVAVSHNSSSDSHLETVLHLEHELITWTTRFYNWVTFQKGFVKALHAWLFKCINTDPIETPDGPAPFSPERAGAPPIFVICEQWAHSIDRISEKEVLDSMRGFAGMVFQFWERDKGEMRERLMANKELERKVKNLDREDMRLQKEIQALDKKVVVAVGEVPDGLSLSGNVVYQSDTSNNTSLQAGLLRIFVAMEKFTSESLSAYEELLTRSEEIVKKYAGGDS